VIDPAAARIIYSLPLQDIWETGAATGSLHLDQLVLRGKWLFYFYDSEMRDATQPSYVALGVLDTSSPYLDLANTIRFLYRGADCGGGQLAWAASSDFVVWQQGWSNIHGGVDVTTSLYDLDIGLQQALPLPAGEMDQFAFAGNKLLYRAGNSQGPYTTLPLPPPGSSRLAPGGRRLPAAAFGASGPEGAQLPGTVYLPALDSPGLSSFPGPVYLPAVVNPAPFYQMTVESDAVHYEVDFNANAHPVPFNATDQEGRELGGGPPCAGLLGSIAGYRGSPPQAVKELLAEDLPPGQLFEIQAGKRILTGHFLNSASGQAVWWQDGSWRYRMLDESAMWPDPADPGLQQELAYVTRELPPDGDLVPGSAQGVVTISPAPDHRSTSVWFYKDQQWFDVEGYNFDAIKGAQRLVKLASATRQPKVKHACCAFPAR
jgi:hypothetical protein